MLLVVLLYTLTNVSYLTAMTAAELLDADAVAVVSSKWMWWYVCVCVCVCAVSYTHLRAHETA